MNARVGRIIKETAKIQKKEGFAHYVDCHAAAQDESFIDGVKTIGAGAPKIAFRAVGDGVGVDVKPRSAGLFLGRSRNGSSQTEPSSETERERTRSGHSASSRPEHSADIRGTHRRGAPCRPQPHGAGYLPCAIRRRLLTAIAWAEQFKDMRHAIEPLAHSGRNRAYELRALWERVTAKPSYVMITGGIKRQE